MLFHSFPFAIFFGLFLTGFVFFRTSASRAVWTGLASVFFYAWWYWPHALLLLSYTLAAFLAVRRARQTARAEFAVWITLILLPLLFFKYTPFLLTLLRPFHADFAPPPSWRLPLGISFITFTTIAYLVDVRRGRYPDKNNLRDILLYLSFFPHLIAGPIMRPNELFPQFAHLRLNKKMLKAGIFLFMIGALKKVLFADQLSVWVHTLYSGTEPLNIAQSAIAFYGFAVQIYCDFSGYTDMAFGLALILGVRLPLNFNRPYQASSIRDFWRRWHITLSRWLRDYLYIPLGGSRHGPLRTILALLITMTLGGLWHGAAWTFVLWGLYHGILLVLEHLFHNGRDERRPRFPLLARLLTLHLVAVGWVLFRAQSEAQILRIFTGFTSWHGWADQAGSMLFPISLIIVFFLVHPLDKISYYCWIVRRLPAALIFGISAATILSCMAFSAGNPSAFIYFDF